jgi:DNA-binding response OmpR family regulator
MTVVVEDNRDIFMDIKRTLEWSISGAKVTIWPGDGEMASAKLVILDLEHDAADVILTGAKNRHKVPIILNAAHNGNPQRLIGALNAGADDYIYKPLNKQD